MFGYFSIILDYLIGKCCRNKLMNDWRWCLVLIVASLFENWIKEILDIFMCCEVIYLCVVGFFWQTDRLVQIRQMNTNTWFNGTLLKSSYHNSLWVVRCDWRLIIRCHFTPNSRMRVKSHLVSKDMCSPLYTLRKNICRCEEHQYFWIGVKDSCIILRNKRVFFFF